MADQFVDLLDIFLVKLELACFPCLIACWHGVKGREGVERIGGDDSASHMSCIGLEEGCAEGLQSGIEGVLELDPWGKSALPLDDAVPEDISNDIRTLSPKSHINSSPVSIARHQY